jgi:hypothetical protein
VSDKGALTRAQKVAGQQMRGEALPGELKDTNVAVRGAQSNPINRFTGNLKTDKAAFYDPTAGR